MEITETTEFATTTRHHVADAPTVQIEGRAYRADFVDVDKMNRNHPSARIGVHMVRLTKAGRPFKGNAQSMWLWSYNGRHDELVADVIALATAPRPTTWQTKAPDLRAGDRLIQVDDVTAQDAVGVSDLLVEQVADDPEDDGWLLVTVWFEDEMVTEFLSRDSDVKFVRGA